MRMTVWRLISCGTTLLLAVIVAFVYVGMSAGDGLDWAFEPFVMVYPVLVLIGLALVRFGAHLGSAGKLLQVTAWLAFALAPVVITGWTLWVGAELGELLRHLGLVAVPALLLILAYLILFRSIRFGWFNVAILVAAGVGLALLLVQGAASMGQAFSSFGRSDLLALLVALACTVGLGIVNFLAVRRPEERTPAPVVVPGTPPAIMSWGAAIAALVFVVVVSAATTSRTVLELGGDSSRQWGEELFVLIENGDLEELQARLDSRRAGISIPPETLVAAASIGNPEAVRILVEAGADIEGETSLDYETAITSAALWAGPETVETLLDLGADPNHGGREILGDSYQWMTPLAAAVRARQPGSVKELLEGGADPDIAPGDGVTPLMLAAEAGDLESARLLVKGGASLDLRERYLEWAAIHFAARYAHHDIIDLLVGAGADAELRDEDGDGVKELLALAAAADSDSTEP